MCGQRMLKTLISFFQKLKFMEPSRVWYQVNPPDPSNNFCAPSIKSTHASERLKWPLLPVASMQRYPILMSCLANF